MSFNVSRSVFVPADQFRRAFYLSSEAGAMPADPTAASVVLRPNGGGADVTCAVGHADPLLSNGSIADHVVRCTVPTGAAPGTYTLRVGGIATDWTGVVIQAAPSPPAGVVVGPHAGWTGPAQAALTAGRPLTLLPGLYYTNGPLTLPAGATINGDGATLSLGPSGTLVTAAGSTAAAGITISGLTVESADPFDLATVVTMTGTPADVVFDHCRFLDVAVGPAAVLTRCQLERSYWSMVGSGGPKLAEQCRFVGANRVAAVPLQVSGFPDGGAAVVDCSFEGTGRGVYCTTGSGPTRRLFVGWCRYSQLHQGGNAGEAFLVEGTHAFDDHLNAFCVVSECPNTAFALWEIPVTNCTVIKMRARGCSQGLVLNTFTNTQTGIEVLYCDFEAYNPAAVGAWSNSGVAVNPATYPDPAADSVTFTGTALTVNADIPYPVVPAHAPAGRVRRVSGAWQAFTVDGDGHMV